MSALIPAWVDGRLTPVDKLEVHRRGLRHKAVSVFVTCGTDVLIQRRAMGKYHTPGLWANTCCTHPGWDEPPEACATRRLQEELGIGPLPLTWQAQVEYRAPVGGGMVEHEVVEIFLARLPEPVTPDPDPAEVMQTDWIDAQALRRATRATPERFTPWLAIYMDRHFDPIFA
jgi:isopentenyl-diphosphate delta-isomerase